MNEREVVCVIDDEKIVRQSLCMLIESLGVELKSYASGSEFLDDPEGLECACLVTDVRMPGLGGLELQSRLRKQNIRIPIIFISGHGDVPMAVQAMRNGALDFLLKPFNHQMLLDRVQQAIDSARDMRREAAQKSAVEARYANLSRREREVLRLIVAGKMNKVVAADLGISTKTVEGHRASIMEKMEARSLAGLVQTMALIAQ